MKGVLIAVALVIAAAAAWFFVSPLFIDEVVDEAPIVSGGTAAVPTAAEIGAMEPAAREQLMTEMMAEAAAAGDRVTDEAMDMDASPLVVASGRFVDADLIHKGSGNAFLYRLPDGSHVIRFEDFAVTNGPALVVLMARSPDIKTADDVQKGGYIKLGELKGNKGNQNYEIPADVNVGIYRSVVIWCELFDVLFSPATLNAA